MLEINEVEYCKVNVKYTANPEVVISKTNEAIKELKKLPIPGFRPNKAPDVAIRAKYKMKIDQWVKNAMLNEAYEDILFETKMQPIGNAQTLDLKLNGNNFNCEFLFLKKPDFELKDVKGLEIPKPHEEVTQEEYVEKILQELRMKNGDNRPFEENDFIQINDVITMDYSFNDKKEEGILYTVGNNILPEFDDNIIGMCAGEEREFYIDLNGEKTLVKIMLHMGMKHLPSPLNDELAIKLGMIDLNQLRSTVEGLASNRLKQSRDAKIAEQVSKKLLQIHDFECPYWLILEEAKRISPKGNIINDVGSTEEVDVIHQDIINKAKDSIKFALILDSIRQKYPEADLSDQEVFNLIKQRVSSQVENADAFLLDLQKKGQLINIVAQFRNEIALQFLIDNAILVE